jgi:FMN phosphatase YigB (HAD superfamily)
MIRALLLDLDDTLLVNDWHTFYPPYLELLAAHMRGLLPATRLFAALRAGNDAMFRSDGSQGTLDQVFMARFLPLAGLDAEQARAAFAAFYQDGFEALQAYTAQDPAAPELVTLARELGLKLAIATQPVFPLEAVQARLRWAGVPAETFAYEYISTFDTQRACKPAPLFFTDLLARLDVAPHEALMAGDSSSSDMAARLLGIKTFYVERGRDGNGNGHDVKCDARGSLADLVDLLRTGAIHEL